jgi:ATP-dependent Zn protease
MFTTAARSHRWTWLKTCLGFFLQSSAITQFVDREIKTIHGMFFTYDKKEQEWEERIKGLQAVSKLLTDAEAIHAPNFHHLFESVLSEDLNHQVHYHILTFNF